jgi:hypothetical protein
LQLNVRNELSFTSNETRYYKILYNTVFYVYLTWKGNISTIRHTH